MKYTFEITITGCAASCAHCYVNPVYPLKFDCIYSWLDEIGTTNILI